MSVTYGSLAASPGSGASAADQVAAPTLTVMVAVAVSPCVSVNFTVNALVPAAVGVPLMV